MGVEREWGRRGSADRDMAGTGAGIGFGHRAGNKKLALLDTSSVKRTKRPPVSYYSTVDERERRQFLGEVVSY